MASEQRAAGMSILEAAVEASKLRFRAILMTAFSAILGFMPLVVASGAGDASCQAIGTAVVGVMAAAVIMSLIFTPVFYVVMQGLSEWRRKPGQATVESLSSAGSEPGWLRRGCRTFFRGEWGALGREGLSQAIAIQRTARWLS